MENSQLICFGEVLWDLLPSGKMAGGAPMNVAFHLNNFGLTANMISRVGADELGNELMEFLSKKQVDTGLIQMDLTYPTGVVEVSLNESGSPTYEIARPAAWDFIEADQASREAVETAEVLIHGSLACRSATTRNTLLQLLDQSSALKVFDVNLREPFYTRTLIEELLHRADVAKMNDEELELIARWLDLGEDFSEQLHSIRDHFNLKKVLVTQGGDGAACLDDQGLVQRSGFRVRVVDTVGCGDSFLAGFILKMLKGEDSSDALEFAQATGALLATQKGGTPVINEQMVRTFHKNQIKKISE